MTDDVVFLVPSLRGRNVLVALGPSERRRRGLQDSSLEPRAVIAGHKRPGNEDSPKIIEETRQYIRDFDRIAETTTTARE